LSFFPNYGGCGNIRIRFFVVGVRMERPGFALAGRRGGCFHMIRALMSMMPNAIPHCEKLQHFVYLKLENKVIV
jgi:hypothetical protein